MHDFMVARSKLYSEGIVIQRLLLYDTSHIIPHSNPRHPYQPEGRLRPSGWYGCLVFGPRADMGVSGWYGVWYENCHIITYLSYIVLSDKYAYLISYTESKARSPSALNVVICFFVVFFFARAKKPYHPHDLVLPGQKKPYYQRDLLSHIFRSTRVICAWKPC